MKFRIFTILLASALVAAGGCKALTGGQEGSRILVVDTSGAPIRGAVIYTDNEDNSGAQDRYSEANLEAHSSNAQGIIAIEMDEFLWESDGCYHFRIRKPGYEEETVSVSRDLFPALYRVDMKPRVPANARPVPQGQGRN